MTLDSEVQTGSRSTFGIFVGEESELGEVTKRDEDVKTQAGPDLKAGSMTLKYIEALLFTAFSGAHRISQAATWNGMRTEHLRRGRPPTLILCTKSSAA